jgi:hypothetical protein
MIKKLLFPALLLAISFNIVYGQNENSLRSKSAGLSMGWYNPDLDFWKNSIAVSDNDFKGAFHAGGHVEFTLANDLSSRIGIGYWKENVNIYDNSTLWSLTGIPVTLDLIYYVAPLRFSGITPFFGLGGEYVFLQQSWKIDQKDDPDPVKGSTALLNGTLGFEARLSSQFAVDIGLTYKCGTYNQDFNFPVENPDDPENPTYKQVTEKISLSGPKIGITLKYLF